MGHSHLLHLWSPVNPMKRKILVAICIFAVIVVLLCLTLFILRYVDIPGTDWDNFLDVRSLIQWELKVKAR